MRRASGDVRGDHVKSWIENFGIRSCSLSLFLRKSMLSKFNNVECLSERAHFIRETKGNPAGNLVQFRYYHYDLQLVLLSCCYAMRRRWLKVKILLALRSQCKNPTPYQQANVNCNIQPFQWHRGPSAMMTPESNFDVLVDSRTTRIGFANWYPFGRAHDIIEYVLKNQPKTDSNVF